MKLYKCEVMDDCDFETVLVVAENEESVRDRIENMNWSCLMGIWVHEISEIDGHKITVQ